MKKRILAASVAAFFGTTLSAFAADLPVKAPPMIQQVYNWTGFYVGVNGGASAMSDPRMTYIDGAINAISPISVTGTSGTSGTGGFHAGYNHQMSNNWLVGVEGDWDWTRLKSSAAPGIICSNLFGMRRQCGGVSNLSDNAFLQTQVNWLASLRARVGYVSNQWMLYATGGLAFADVRDTGNIFCTGVVPTLCPGGGETLRSSSSDIRFGAVLGAGVEYKVTRNWIVGAEYLFYRFDGPGSSAGSYTFNGSGAPAPFYECGTGQNCGAFSYGHFDVHTGRVRVSYQFN